MKDPVVVAHSDSRAAADYADNATGWTYLFILGLGVAAVGMTEVVLTFFPAQWANLDWEFPTIAGFFDSLPLVTIGIGSMAAAAMANHWRVMRRVMIGLLLFMSLLILVMLVIFALDVPVVVRAVDPAARHSLKLASLKSGLEAGTYFLLYLALGVWTWRRSRRA